MIDGTIIVLLLALGISALGRHLYRRGWHEGRAALLREQKATTWFPSVWAPLPHGSAGLQTWIATSEPFDQEADA